MTKIRVLVVDDSAFMRRNLPRLLESDPDIEVVGVAADGAEGLEAARRLRPDVITLDVRMPVMDGLTALRRLMAEQPTPVVMVSSLTQEGAAETLEALALGAVEVVAKPSELQAGGIADKRGELVTKIRLAFASRIKLAAEVDVTRDKFRQLISDLSRGRPVEAPPALASGAHPLSPPRRLVAIAASTGGPAALQALLPSLPANLNAGVLVVQHIAAGFTSLLADRLNQICRMRVREAEDGLPILPGVILICPGDVHLRVARAGDHWVARLSPEPAEAVHRPSANVLYESLAAAGPETCAVILTGMGDDGAQGMRALRAAGGHTLAQDEATSLIYGMPRRAVELGGVVRSLPLEALAVEIVRAVAGAAEG